MPAPSPEQVVQTLIGAYKCRGLYPPDHPETRRQLEHFASRLLAALRPGNSLRIGLLEGTLFLDNHLFVEPNPAAAELAALLKSLELEGLEFHCGLTTLELEGLFQVISEHQARGDRFEPALRSRGVRHIRPVRVKPQDHDTPESRKVYQRALEVVDRIFQDVRIGNIPASEPALNTIKTMARMTLTEPHALFAMSLLKDYDNYTFNHSVNVAVIALTVGRACGLDENDLRILGLGALLHDIGKLEIDWSIINKPGQLTDAEFEEIKRHPLSGAEIVGKMEGIRQEVIDIVLGHHVHFNRDGYPIGVEFQKASPLVDMAAIADTYDAMTTLRSYQRPIPPSQAARRLRELSGSTLNPRMVERFIDFLGPWPVGTLVRLDNNQIGLVIRVSSEPEANLQLKILFDGEGRQLTDYPVIELSGKDLRKVVAEVDPFVKGIQVTDYLD